MKNQKLQIAMLVGEIQTLVYMVNEFTNYCAFFNFSGHVCSIDVSIRESRTNYTEHVADTSVYSMTQNPEKAIEKLTVMKSNLRKILRKNEVDYSRLNYTIEEVRHYKLV
ncbi:hypothetical protein [Paenibacillus sp. LjRoot56]|uniref:hypothetical protein n=1 Tax=Paenibacillus sp. LjRoot56 TaxID=3342333 RepID=UPI003ECCF098